MAASSSSRRSVGLESARLTESIRQAIERVTRLLPVSRFVVTDDSMLPAYAAGDRIVVNRFVKRERPGDVVVLRDPEMPQRYLLKRIAGMPEQERVDVRGDNADASRDSRQFGPVPRRSIIGTVWFKY